MRINNSVVVLQAAIDGQGIALARSVMARDDLAAGRLVRLFPEVEFALALTYYVVYRLNPPACLDRRHSGTGCSVKRWRDKGSPLSPHSPSHLQRYGQQYFLTAASLRES